MRMQHLSLISLKATGKEVWLPSYLPHMKRMLFYGPIWTAHFNQIVWYGNIPSIKNFLHDQPISYNILVLMCQIGPKVRMQEDSSGSGTWYDICMYRPNVNICCGGRAWMFLWRNLICSGVGYLFLQPVQFANKRMSLWLIFCGPAFLLSMCGLWSQGNCRKWVIALVYSLWSLPWISHPMTLAYFLNTGLWFVGHCGLRETSLSLS